MSPQLHRASLVAGAATMLAAIVSSQGSGAAAQELLPLATAPQAAPAMISQPVVQTLPAADEAADVAATQSGQDDAEPASDAATLAELVAEQPHSAQLPSELHCLAGAIYFEAKSESLAGQLAVARVITARAKSGRFPTSYCGVVYQPSQFSFVRGRSMPGIATASQDWREAVAIAQIADSGSWRSPVEGALFFHAKHVSPRWRLTRIARVDNHVFYR